MTKTNASKARAKRAPKAAQRPSNPGRAANAKPKPKGKGPANAGASFPATRATRGYKEVTVEEDEFIANVNGSVSFATTKYSLNPGQAATFPWLHKQAALYEKWRLLSCEFYYMPTVSGFSADGQTGKVMLMCDYDAIDPPPTAKKQVEAAYLHADGMPYEEIRMRVDPKEANDRGGRHGKYVRAGFQPVNTDIRLYDGGNLFVSTQGTPTTNAIGELRVRYRFGFSVPVLEDGTPALPILTTTGYSQVLDVPLTSLAYEALPFEIEDVNALEVVNAAGELTAPAGTYVVHANVQFSGAGNILYTQAAFAIGGVIQPSYGWNEFDGGKVDRDSISIQTVWVSDGAVALSVRGKAWFTGGMVDMSHASVIIRAA